VKTIHISPATQVMLGLGLLAAAGAAVQSQMPEITRYLKVRQM
jgi:hypothetical protein